MFILKEVIKNILVLVSGHYVCNIQLISRVNVQVITIFSPYILFFFSLPVFIPCVYSQWKSVQAISSARGGPTYSSASQSSPWKQSWQWRSLAALGHAPRTGDTHCPWKCQFSSPQSRRSCRGGARCLTRALSSASNRARHFQNNCW